MPSNREPIEVRPHGRAPPADPRRAGPCAFRANAIPAGRTELVKVLAQVIGTGDVSIREVPAPGPAPGALLVRSRASLISSGTEAMLLDFGRSGLLQKARSQPDRVQQVLAKVRTDGLLPTIAAVRDKLGDILTPGYCQAGVVIEAGDPDAPFAAGDHVVTNGPHAEVVRVPYNLSARVPDGVGFESAAFAPLAAIALQGLRLAAPTLGETVVVYGLGLVGQLAVQLVRANGSRCVGIDTDADRVALAERFGATGILADEESVAEAVRAATGGVGADAVLMTLATESHEPMHEAAAMSRKRGRIVLVGVTGLNLSRADFYEKELSFRVSCSYGPGRYDPEYEERGVDYPLPYVRWTAQRNFKAVLALMASGSLDTAALVTHRFPLGEATAAYDLLLADEASLGIILTYPAGPAQEDAETRGRGRAARGGETSETSLAGGAAARAETGTRTIALRAPPSVHGGGAAGIIGAGNFARRTMIPAIRAAGIDIRTVVSSRGLAAAVEGERAGAAFASSDVDAVLSDGEIDTVFVLTRHDSHAALAVRALAAGKHVFVEKPLGLSIAEIDAVRAALEESGRLITVGFNRRFAPLANELRRVLQARSGPASLIMTVNAGRIDRRHWTQDAERGGGRIVGEACHFIDLARFLIAAPIEDLTVRAARDARGSPLDDVSHLTLAFGDGSTAAIHYLATGAARFPKERVEAFFDGRTASIDNWRRLRTWGIKRLNRPFGRQADKGHRAELTAFAAALGGGSPPIPYDEIFEVSRWAVRAAELARGGA